MIKEVERIHVIDAHGSKLQIICYQEFHTEQLLDGSRTVSPGLKYYEDMNRNKVNKLSDKEFQVVRTGERLTRIN